MANKPFEIQSSTIRIGGVNLQAGASSVVIPGVTQAVNYFVEEIDELNGTNPDTFGSDAGAITIIDNAEYTYLSGTASSASYVPATYSVSELDDGEIEEIDVETVGVFLSADVADIDRGNMWATTTPTPFVAFDPNNWTQIAFRPRMRAGEVENIGGGGGSLTVGNGTSASVENVTELLINGTITEIEPGVVGITVAAGDSAVSYKGFKAVYARMYDDEPTISKVLIYQDSVTTTPTLEVDADTDDDLFKVSGLANSSVIALVNIYGADSTYPTALSTLQHFVKSIVDDVILGNGNAGSVGTAEEMGNRFYSNFDTFASRAGNRYKNFYFPREEWLRISLTGGSGTGAVFDLFRQRGTDVIDDSNTRASGINYQVGDEITILGASLDGATPDNNVVITVVAVGLLGEIDQWNVTGSLPVDAFPLDNIEDGGNDQYDRANYIYTNIQGNSNQDGDYAGEWALDYHSGTVNAGDPWFGVDSEYVVTYNNSIFGLFVTGANINWIATDGNSGFDGDGQADTGSLDMADTDGLINGNHTFRLNADGSVTWPDGSVQPTAYVPEDPNVWVQDFETTDPQAETVATANSVEYLPNGDIVAVFYHFYNGSDGRYNSIARFTPTGEKVWSMKFSGALYTDGWGLAVDNNFGAFIYLAGSASGDNGYDVAVITKLEQSNGAIIWSKTYDVGYENTNVVVDVTGNDIVIVGYAFNGVDRQIVTTRIQGGTGDVIWSRALDGQGSDEAYGMAVDNNNNGEIVTVGYVDQVDVTATRSVTPLTGSATDVLVINRSDLAGSTLTDTWTVSGTGITGTASIAQINVYNAVTGTVRQGSGATFDITAGSNYSTVIVDGGTNYLAGHIIKILGSALGGVDVTNDLTITVTAVEAGAITNINYGGTSAAITTNLAIAATVDYDTWTFASVSYSGTTTITNPQGTLLTALQDVIPSGAVGGVPALGGTYVLTSAFADQGSGVWSATYITNPSFPMSDGSAPSGNIVWTDTTNYNALTGTNYQTGSGLSFDFFGDSGSTYTEPGTNIIAGGTDYVDGDVVTIPGTQLGGTSPEHDLVATVSTADGAVTQFNTFTGTAQTTTYRILLVESVVDFSGVGTWTLNGTTVDTDDRMLVVKYDSTGGILWQRAVQVEPGYNCSGADAATDSDGNIYVCGNFNYALGDGTGQAIIIIKFSSSGVKQWTRKIQGACEDVASSIVVGSDNCLYLSAFTANGPDYSMVIAKYNLDGTVEWQRLLDSITNWTFAGQFFFSPGGTGGGSTIAVRPGYVAVVGGFGNFADEVTPHAILAQFDADGKTFTRGDYDFNAASYSGLLNSTASDITVTDAGKVSSDYADAFTTGPFSPTFDLASNLLGTIYRKIVADNELGNGNHVVSLNANGSVTLPAGGTIAEGYVTSNPTIQLTPARPTVASQKLVIKGGGNYNAEDNGIALNHYLIDPLVGDTVEIYVNSSTYANQTLYWWISPADAGIATPQSGTVSMILGAGESPISFVVDSDDYEFTVRVSPENNNYGPGVVGVETQVFNSAAPTFADHHLHLTTGDLSVTSIILGTDNHNVRTTTDGGIQLTTQTTVAELPHTITITGADVTSVNLVYTRDLTETTPTWTSPEIVPVSDPYIVFDGEWGIVAPDYGTTPLYVNTGTLITPLTQWNTNPPLGSVAPTGVYTYLTPDVHAWLFGTDGGTTFPNGGGDNPTTEIYPTGNGSQYLFESYYNGVRGTGTYLKLDADSGVITIRPHSGINVPEWTFDADGTLTLPLDGRIQTIGDASSATLQWLPTGGGTSTNTAVIVSSNGVTILTDAPNNENTWLFGTDGNLTLPGAVVNSTVAKTGVVLPTLTGIASILVHDSVLTGLTDSNYGPFTLGTVTFGVNVTGGILNNFSSVSSTANVSRFDVLGTIDSGDIGGTAGTSITISVDEVVQATPTAIDLTKSINKLGDGAYTLADGVEGQIMYLVRQNAAVNIYISVANARVYGGIETNWPLALDQDIVTLIYTDSAWQQTGGTWD